MTTTPIFSTTVESMPVTVYNTNTEVGLAAAADAAEFLKQVLRERGHANVILATGNSQLTFLHTLRATPGIDWSRIFFFHMDEYINLPAGHPASFPLFLQRHFLEHLSPAAGAFYPVPGPHTKAGERPEDVPGLKEYEDLLKANPADLCALGIGMNGHLAFNDPPYADFNDPVWVKPILLSEMSRRQQLGEGHFPDLNSVPTHAITLTIPALLAARKVLAIVPERRKAEAVKQALEGPVDPNWPASILRRNPHVNMYLDRDSASLTYELEG
jgi:glucosamine-6-phosphate deaminase